MRTPGHVFLLRICWDATVSRFITKVLRRATTPLIYISHAYIYEYPIGDSAVAPLRRRGACERKTCRCRVRIHHFASRTGISTKSPSLALQPIMRMAARAHQAQARPAHVPRMRAWTCVADTGYPSPSLSSICPAAAPTTHWMGARIQSDTRAWSQPLPGLATHPGTQPWEAPFSVRTPRLLTHAGAPALHPPRLQMFTRPRLLGSVAPPTHACLCLVLSAARVRVAAACRCLHWLVSCSPNRCTHPLHVDGCVASACCRARRSSDGCQRAWRTATRPVVYSGGLHARGAVRY
jgi:hypothetical protein